MPENAKVTVEVAADGTIAMFKLAISVILLDQPVGGS